MRKGSILGLGLLLLSQPVTAQVAEPQALIITATNVTAEAQDRSNAATGASVPGDVIEYRLTFTNHTDGVVSQVVLNDPIPDGLVFVLGSVTGSREDVLVEYSIDEAATWSADPVVEVDVGGQTVRRPAPPAAFTHVRWTVTGPVSPGAQVTARFRALVEGAPNPRGDS